MTVTCSSNGWVCGRTLYPARAFRRMTYIPLSKDHQQGRPAEGLWRKQAVQAPNLIDWRTVKRVSDISACETDLAV